LTHEAKSPCSSEHDFSALDPTLQFVSTCRGISHKCGKSVRVARNL
jgi:hypothetical protein